MGFPGGSVVKDLPANKGDGGDVGLIPGSGSSPGVGNGNSLQYSCLDIGAWRATIHEVASQIQLSEHACMHAHTCTHTHTHIIIYIYIYVCVRVCVCERESM